MPEETPRLSRPWRAWFWLEHSTIGLPLALLALDIVGTNGAADGGWQQKPGMTYRPLDWVAWTFVVAGPVALHHRRRVPLIALFVALGATLAYLLRGYVNGPIYLNAMVAVVSAIGTGYRREAWAGASLFALGMLFVPSHTVGSSRLNTVDILSTAGWFLAITLISELIRVLRQRAQEAMRIKEEEARRQASDERLAIARELHDVLAHSISLIAVQANVALEVMDRKPDQARIALVAIKDARKSALGEGRSVLNGLPGPQAAPPDPAPALDRLGHLVTQAEAAGLKTVLSVVGDVPDAPLAVSQAGDRSVQEALTNVGRHANATRANILD